MATVQVETSGKARRVQSEEVRRGQILAAAQSLIAEQGYERTTTAQIAKRAGISEGTIYNYFPSKVAVVSALKERAMRAIIGGAFARVTPGLQGAALIRTLLEGAFAAARDNAELMRAFSLNVELREVRMEACDGDTDEIAQFTEELHQFFAAQQESGSIPRSVDVGIMTRLMIGTVDFAMEDCIVNGHAGREATYIDLLVRMFSRAMYVE